MPDPANPAPPPAAPVSAAEREVRRRRIMERVQRGWRYELIAEAEDLTPRRIRQIIQETLALREVDPAGGHVRLQTARLEAALRLAARGIKDGELGAIDQLRRVLDRLDRYQARAAAAACDGQDGAAPTRPRARPSRDDGRRAARASRGRRARAPRKGFPVPATF